MTPEQLEALAMKAWYENRISDARSLHYKARESNIPWILENDYWFYEPDIRVDEDFLKTKKTHLKDARISVLVVSYARPEGAMRCATSARLTADRQDLLEVLIVTDESDELKDRYKKLPELNTYVIDKHRTSDKWNFLYQRSTGDILVLVADDVIFETRGWDEILRKSWPEDGIAVMFSDSSSGKELLEFPIVSRKMTELLGYVAYPEMQHAGLDTFWHIIGKELGRLYYLGKVWNLRHQHYETSQVHVRSERKGINVIRDYGKNILQVAELMKGYMKNG